jgi:hypothetical protein
MKTPATATAVIFQMAGSSRSASSPPPGVEPSLLLSCALAVMSSTAIPQSSISSTFATRPRCGKICSKAKACISAEKVVAASSASTTAKPCSCAARAVDSTPMLVATPPITTVVTPPAQLQVQIRAVERAPLPLGDLQVGSFGEAVRQFAPVFREAARRRLHRPIDRRFQGVAEVRGEGHVDQHHRRLGNPEAPGQFLPLGEHGFEGLGRELTGDDPLLQVDQDPSRAGGGQGDHWVSFWLVGRPSPQLLVAKGTAIDLRIDSSSISI